MAIQRNCERSGRDWSGGEAGASQQDGPLFDLHVCSTDVRDHGGDASDHQESDSQGCQSCYQPAAYSDGKHDDSPNDHEQ